MYGTGVITFWERLVKEGRARRDQLDGICDEMSRYWGQLGYGKPRVSLDKKA